MRYYLGKAIEFKKEECKEYKKLDAALKAAAKDENFVVWDENGQVIGSLTDNVPEGALQTKPNGSVPAFDEDGISVEMIDEQENAEEQEDKVIIPQGKMKVTVICDGSLNIRRSAERGNDNICGRAVKGQSYYVKEIHIVDGKKMVRTIGDLYLSGQSEYVQFEQL